MSNKTNDRLNYIKSITDDNIICNMIDSCKIDKESPKKNFDIRELMPKKFLKMDNVINKLGGQLLYIKSGASGHTFKGTFINSKIKKKNYAVKVVAYPKKDRYGNIYDVMRPENAELLTIQLLSNQFVKPIQKEKYPQTPHIVLPITTFYTDISTFLNLDKEDIVNNKKYKEFKEKQKKGDYYNKVSILISEWASEGDLLDYIRKNNKDMNLKFWTVILFQIISVLAIIHAKFPNFRHNDLKGNNILLNKIEKNKKYFLYKINNQHYLIPNIGYQIKLWDFDFACIPGIIENKKVNAKWTSKINIEPKQNRYYDIHYFMNTLTRKGFFSDFWKEGVVPEKIKKFFNRIVPDKYRKGKHVSERGRILVNDEYMIPADILLNDPLFKKFKKNPSDLNI